MFNSTAIIVKDVFTVCDPNSLIKRKLHKDTIVAWARFEVRVRKVPTSTRSPGLKDEEITSQ